MENFGDRNFTSGRIQLKHGFTFGRFEIRAKLPAGKNLFPAIWMLPCNNTYGKGPASGEIDIMEYRGERNHTIQGTIHFGGFGLNYTSKAKVKTYPEIDFSKDWHTFAVEWNKTDIKWFVDDDNYHSEDINKMMWSGKGENPYTKNGQPFDIPFYLILNVAVGGRYFPENVYGHKVTVEEARKWEKPSMEIDFVKVYKWIN